MAEHVIEQVKQAVVSALSSMITVPQARVFFDRVYALEQEDLPCVLVSLGDETAAAASYGSGLSYDREIAVDVMVCVAHNTLFDKNANEIQKEVEQAMAADSTLGNLVTNVRYSGRNKSANGDGDVKFISLSMSYHASYRTDAQAPDIAI